jgi:integrase
VRVEQTIAWTGATPTAIPPKTKGSRRAVPLTPATSAMLRDYLAVHPRHDEPTAPLFPSVRPTPLRPSSAAPLTLNQPVQQPGIEPGAHATALRQATALADLSAAEAAERLVLDWSPPTRHATFYKAVFRPAVLRANRRAAALGDPNAALPPQLKFHALRHTYASLCIAAGRPPLEIARFMGHARPSTTEAVYAHLFNTDDHAAAMSALGAIAARAYEENVVRMRV